MAVVFEGGLTAWSPDPLVSAANADAYALARGWSDWAALSPERKAGAILDASTYVRVSFAPPSTLTTARTATIEAATVEAARLSLTSPLIGGQSAGAASKRRVKAGSVEVEFADASSTDLNNARLALVSGLLRSAGAYGIGGANVRLSRS